MIGQELEDRVQSDGDEQGEPDDDEYRRDVGDTADDDIRHGDAERPRQADEEWSPPVEGPTEGAERLVVLLEVALHAGGEDKRLRGRLLRLDERADRCVVARFHWVLP